MAARDADARPDRDDLPPSTAPNAPVSGDPDARTDADAADSPTVPENPSVDESDVKEDGARMETGSGS
jgi:hypothetical protein